GIYTYTSNYLGALTSKNLTFIPGGESRLSIKFKESSFIAGLRKQAFSQVQTPYDITHLLSIT
ncbi:MAG: hypothetical protein RBR69_09775, partial [Candidatus Cloacimonadaceae bacterium]|nr:hypothetical protein [Candidatus Cloacimonadaceae bacterium]